MLKPTPNPPETDSIPHDPALDPQKLKEATDRALNYYLNTAALKETPRKPSTLFSITPGADHETLLANACETLASASVMASDFADNMMGTQRSKMLALQQIIMLGELAVNRMLDNVDPQA
jgi:hypothetical protein